MNQKFIRESAYRGERALGKLGNFHVTIAGVGALGSNLLNTLSRQGFENLRAIDKDRVEEKNLGTQNYGMDDIGALKVEAARNLVFRNVEQEIEVVSKELTSDNIHKLLKGTNLVIDAFDNSLSRRILRDHCLSENIPCLHLGLFEGYGEVVWNADYRVPNDSDADICDYPMARNLVMLVVAIAAESIVDFASAAIPRGTSHSVTLNDLKISPY